MNTYIERKLKKFASTAREKRIILSCDIYYDDLRGEFVVKLHNTFGAIQHFRSNHIRKSLKMALKWLEGLRRV